MTQSQKCLTLVTNLPANQSYIIKKISTLVTVEHIDKRQDNVFDVVCPADTMLTPELRQCLYRLHIDFALQDNIRPVKKLFISDMDSTIVIGETIDEIAEVLGIRDEISAITAAAMRGELDFEAALAQRLALLKGIKKETIASIAERTKTTPGADNLLNELNRLNIYSCLISGGFTLFTERVSRQLGFQQHIANRFSYDGDNRLDGTWVGELISATVKERTLITLAKDKQISLAETIAIGDGANDQRMINRAGLGIAFYGKPLLRQSAQAEIHSGTIDNLLWFL
ncbi:MAG: phosphoserine phosphatase SerB [Gammaproteobacteria bacterium]|nr:MAG: phosphoserine phosphatase SerB [Gammaproteobacteria bacterium]